MKAIAAFPLLALALTACEPYMYGTGAQPYPQNPQGYPQTGYPQPGYPQPGYPQPYPPTGYPQSYPPASYPQPNYPQPGPPMPPGGPVYPGPGQPTYPAPGYPSSGETSYRAIGTEPFWDLEIGRDLIFTDRGNNVSVSQPAPQPIQGTAGPIYRTERLEVNITHQQCSDGMSDRRYPDTVDVRVDGRQRYRGCGAPIEYFTQVGETGQPNYQAPDGSYGQPSYPGPASQYGQPAYPGSGSQYGQPAYPGSGSQYGQPGYPGAGAPQGMPVINLSGTNWRVLSINGTRTPASNFYVNFMPDRIGAKFGCNSLGAGYTQSGHILTVGAIMATRMACPDMGFENQGSSILMQPMTINGLGNRITLSNSRGMIELGQAR